MVTTNVFTSQPVASPHAFLNIVQDDQVIISDSEYPRDTASPFRSHYAVATRTKHLDDTMVTAGVDAMSCSSNEMMSSGEFEGHRTRIIEWIESITRRFLTSQA